MVFIKKLINFFKKPDAKQLQHAPLTKPEVQNDPQSHNKGHEPRKSRSNNSHSGKSNNRNKEKNRSHQKSKYPSKNNNRTQRQQKSAPTSLPIIPKGKEFKDFDLHPDLVELLKNSHFTHATEVQEKSLASTISGKNIFCSSETGSGKTLSFLIPMIHKFYNKEIDQALIVCPTREIAIQIQKTIAGFKDESLTSTLVIGGTNMKLQKEALQKYPKILVATPGRLLDTLNSGLIWLEYTGYVVLDEADRMLDMGFEDELNQIHAQLTGKHQLILFSATLSPEIKKMATRYADTFEEIVVGNPNSVAGSVEHVLVEMNDDRKLAALEFLVRKNRGKVIVFFNTIQETGHVTRQLKRKRIGRVDCIHSKVIQSAREHIIAMFREGEISVLLASDVAARGIDIPNVELIVNFDVPNNSEEYIHRVGRTGRAGQTGIAITFYTHKDKKKLTAIEKLIDSKIRRVRDYRDIL